MGVEAVSEREGASPIAPGTVLDDRFEIVSQLGAGGMGAVYEAIDRSGGGRIAIKLMRPELHDSERAVERFRREGAALATIRSPSVVEVREVGSLHDGTLYLAMERLAGVPLSTVLASERTLSPDRLRTVVAGVCDALETAHAAGVVHRDIKPSNIHVVDPSAVASPASMTRGLVKLLDFGVARIGGFGRMTSTGVAIGTVRYMAPEQLSGATIDGRVDTYALGVVLYEALAGESPFARTGGDDPVGAILVGRTTPLGEIRGDVSPSIARVIARAMARLPADRFGSASEMAAAWERALADPYAFAEPMPASGERPSYTASHTSPGLHGWAEPSGVPLTREVKTTRRRPPWVLALPLVLGVCGVPTLGVAGFAGCSRYLAEVQMRSSLREVRGELDRHAPELDDARPAIQALSSLHQEGRVGLLAATAFNARAQAALQDTQLDAPEAARLAEVAEDIVAHGGDYDADHYEAMTRDLDADR
ncbi:MAG: serine/threonine-protein kinase [Sandaracinaceae bacterium]